MFILKVSGCFLLFTLVTALYGPNDDVVILESDNFDRLVNTDQLWIVNFYTRWCRHSKALAPDYKKAATALKNIVNVGAVECDHNEHICDTNNIREYPTVKIFLGGIAIKKVEEPSAEVLIAVGLEQYNGTGSEHSSATTEISNPVELEKNNSTEYEHSSGTSLQSLMHFTLLASIEARNSEKVLVHFK